MGGIQADLRVVSDAEFPFALAYFTGSKEHNIVMRQRAIQRGLRLNEYGLFKSAVETRDPQLRVACRTEEEIYQQLGLAYISARAARGQRGICRRGKGACRACWNGRSLKARCTTTPLGATATIRSRKSPLICRNWAALIGRITDHSKSSFQANGLDPERLRQQIEAIKKPEREIRGRRHPSSVS